MKTKFKKKYLPLAISSMLLAIVSSYGAKSAAVGVDSAKLRGNLALPSTTLLASINRTGTASGTGISATPALSADGRFVAFFSTNANDLVDTDGTNNTYNIFVRDLKTRTTSLASVNSAGTATGNGDSFTFPVLSVNGRFVAFVSEASDLVTNDTNDTYDVFVRDLMTGTTKLANVNSAGTDSGNGASFNPVLSADGRFVAFDSRASDLVANDTNGTGGSAFVRDLKTGTTTKLLSVNSAGTATGDGFPYNPVLSANGRFVAFGSLRFTNDPDASLADLFVRDLKTGTTKLLSVNSAGTASANGFSFNPVLSADGRFVAFVSNANDLAANDANATYDVFVRDFMTGTTKLLSVNSAGTAAGNGSSFTPALSADGRFVAFHSNANDLVANDTNDTSDVFVRDLNTGTTKLVSINSAGTASGNDDSAYPELSVSADGRFVAFQSNASDLVANDTNGTSDVFVRDLKAGTTKLLSVNSAGTATGNGQSLNTVLSANGRFVAFDSYASDLVANDTNGEIDVFVRPIGK
jgi:WD40-like Beta Propeller Repeat